MAAVPENPVPTLYEGLSFSLRVPSSTISISDLRRLYTLLDEKSQQACVAHIEALRKPPQVSEEQFAAGKELMRRGGRLTVVVIGASGEQIVDQSAAPLDGQRIPDRITSVVFDSFENLQGRHGILLLNRFKLTLDLADSPWIDTYNPWANPTPNQSILFVIGSNHTWVTAVRATVIEFFTRKGRRRSWLHTFAAFNLLTWLVGLPSALWIVSRLNIHFEQVSQYLDDAGLLIAANVYLVLLLFLLFRTIVYSLRWLFPLIEIEGSRSVAMRRIITGGIGALLVALIYDVLKALLWVS